MTRPKMTTPPIRGIDMAKFIEMAMKISTEAAGGRRGLRAVAPVMDGMIAYASEAMLPALAQLSLLVRDHPVSLKTSEDGWRIAHVAGTDPREIDCLMAQEGLSGGWLVRARFKTSLSDDGRAKRVEQFRQLERPSDLAAEIAGMMKVDAIIESDASCHAPAADGDQLREILIFAVDLSGPPPGAQTGSVAPSPCTANAAGDMGAAALRLRPQAFMADGAPSVSSSDSGQHGGIAALRAVSGLIEANGFSAVARQRHEALSSLGWKQFGDAGNACLLGVGMAMVGASGGLLDAAAVERLNRFARDILAVELRRIMPDLPNLARVLLEAGHVSPETAWAGPGDRLKVWLDAAARAISCLTEGVHHALPLAPDGNGDVVIANGAIEVARVCLAHGRVRDDDRVGGDNLPPPIRTLTDTLLAVQMACRALAATSGRHENRHGRPEYT